MTERPPSDSETLGCLLAGGVVFVWIGAVFVWGFGVGFLVVGGILLLLFLFGLLWTVL